MFEKHIEEIKKITLEAYPKECVIAVLNDKVVELKNISDEPTKEFKLSKKDIKFLYDTPALALVHSHPDYYACPSEADMIFQEESMLPWGIIATDGNSCSEITWFGDSLEKKPLVGRGFIHGVTDCYSLIRDYYLLEKQIHLIDFPRDWEWWKKDKNLYVEGFSKAGFYRLDTDKETPKEGDVFLVQIRSDVPNHGGIYLGEGLALHHLTARLPYDPMRLSLREPIHRWKDYITYWLRYDK